MKEFAWAVVFPSGKVHANTDWVDEQQAWDYSLVCVRPYSYTVDEAKAKGFRVIRVRLFEVGPA